jgi:hypothetical protein
MNHDKTLISNMTVKEESGISIFHLVEFAAVVAVSFLFGAVAFYRVLGILGAAHGLVIACRRNIPVGIEGREPSFYLQGKAAIVAGVTLALICAALSWFAPEMACYFSEGRECK